MPKNKWTDAFLDEMRMTSDPEADKAAAALFADKNYCQVFSELGAMATNDAIIPASFPVDLSEYFNQDLPIFSLEEQRKLDLAAKVFKRYGLHACIILYFKSLPTGYLCPYPAHVLSTTRLLVTNTTRRVLETAQYVFDVNRDNWLDPKGRGLNAIKKVRLMHASMRLWIQNNPDTTWDKQKLGIPINQEDMVLTLQLFSLAIFEGLQFMGIRLTHHEKEAYFFKWKVVGRLMGIDPRLEPESILDAISLQKKILSRSVKLPNADGPILAKELLDMVHDHMPPKIKHSTFEKATMFFIDNYRTAESLGFQKASKFDHLFDLLIKMMMKLKIWHKMYPPKIAKGRKPHFLQKLIKSIMYKRLGLVYNWRKPIEVDPLDTFSKYLLKSLTENVYLTSARKFTIDPSLLDEWGVDDFQFSEGIEIESA